MIILKVRYYLHMKNLLLRSWNCKNKKKYLYLFKLESNIEISQKHIIFSKINWDIKVILIKKI